MSADAEPQHRLVFTNDGFSVTLEAEGIADHYWPQLVAAVMDQISKPRASAIFPGPISDEEAERIRKQWSAKP